MKQKLNFIKNMLMFSFLLVCLHANAQEGMVSGTITDATNQPLPGANVLVKGTGVGVQSDFDGKYRIVAKSGTTIVISYMGYTTKEIKITNQKVVNVSLSEDSDVLDEVLIIGYGKQSRETVSSAIASVDTDEIENIVYSNATQALQGRVAGLTVVNSSGQPGASPSIVLRGGSSISGGSAPLYIVDGVERNEIKGLRSDNIKTMQVLKDATSTAVYGARGSNGVIIITTKTGTKGKSEITYKSRLGFSSFRNENFRQIGGADYIAIARLGQVNSGLFNNSVVTSYGGDARAAALGGLDNANSYGTGNDLTNNTLYTTMLLNDDNSYLLGEGYSSMVDPVTGKDLIFKDTDWYDVNYQTGVRKENNFSFSGADEKSSFYLGLGALNDEGILVNTNYDLYSAVLNSDRKLTDNFRVFGKFEMSHEMTDQPSGFSSSNFSSSSHLRNAILRSPNMAPSTKYTFADGSLAPGVNQMMANPEYVNDHLIQDERKTRWTALFGFDWDITEDLNFSPKGSIYHVETLQNTSMDAYLNGTSLNTNRIKRAVTAVNWIKQFDGVLSYNKTLNDVHNFNLTGVASYSSKDYFYSNSASKMSGTDVIHTMGAGTEAHDIPYSKYTKDVMIGFVGRLIYDYNKTYLFQASLRRDGSSRFGSDNQWGTFKGLSFGWNAHNEAFYKDLGVEDVVSKFKIRASYGETGNNNNLGLYTWQGEYGTDIYGGSGAVYKKSLSNAGLKWETTKTFDVGLDLGLFNDRVAVLVDYYDRRTTDLLQSISLPASTGFKSIKTNFAELGNNGIEVAINAQVIRSEDFSWDLGVNYAHNTTKVLKLPENGIDNNRIGGIQIADPNDPTSTIWVGGYQEGQELGKIYGYVADGVYDSWEEAVADGIVDTKANGGNGRFIMDENFQIVDTNGDGLVTTADRVAKGGGDVKWKDLNGDGVINSLDRTYLGNSKAPHVGGIINTFRYKDITLRVNMDYAIGHTVYDYETRYRNGRYTANLTMMPGMTEMWTPLNTTSSVAQYYQGDPMGNWNRGGSNLYSKGDYLCLRDVSLNYVLPEKWLSKLPLSKVEVYGTGQNLYYFTKYDGYQPEKGGTSDQNNFQYPLPRTLTLGVNVSF